MQRLREYVNDHRFTVFSWAATIMVVAAILTSTIWLGRLGSGAAALGSPPTAAGGSVSGVGLPPTLSKPIANPSIARQLALKTDISLQTNAKPFTYRVMVGDFVFAIRKAIQHQA